MNLYAIENALGRGFSIGHLNVRSLWSKLDIFRAHLQCYDFDVFAVSETWLTSSFDDSLVHVKGYNIVRTDRNTYNANDSQSIKKGGGVAFYIKDNLEYKIIDKSETATCRPSMEYLTIAIKAGFLPNFIISVAYKPPTVTTPELLEYLETSHNSFRNFPQKNKELFILGDFNVDMRCRTADCLLLKNHSTALGLSQQIEATTHFGRKDSILDLIFTNSAKIKSSGTLNWEISDHEVIFVTRKQVARHHKSTKLRGRSHANYSYEALETVAGSKNWEFMNDCDLDLENKWLALECTINECLDEICPIKDIVIRNDEDPWMTPDVYALINDKRELKRQAVISGLPGDFELARKARNHCNKYVKQAKSNHLKNLQVKFKGDSKRFWQSVASVLP